MMPRRMWIQGEKVGHMWRQATCGGRPHMEVGHMSKRQMRLLMQLDCKCEGQQRFRARWHTDHEQVEIE
eukprot:6196451-Pleurochrysis_carterae.AAC.2